MKTEYKYIRFDYDESIEDDCKWWCYNKKSGGLLRGVTYYRSWKQYVIEFEIGCVFNNSCLTDISHFLDQLNSRRAEKNRK